MLEQILPAYGISESVIIQPYGSGLINHTWKVRDQKGEYILQKINHEVFKEPQKIAANIKAIASWLEKNQPDYFFVAPVQTLNGESLLYHPGEGYFRLFLFVKDSCTYDVAQSPQQAFQAAKQFGLFTRRLSGFPAGSLKTTLPDFHNLGYRYALFEQAAQHGNPLRILETEKAIHFLRLHDHIVATWQKIVSDKEFRLRVTHHDTKISNVLFDREGQGICVIDLDTVMPGHFISDAGDMLRTYLSPVSEEEKDFDKIRIREEYFQAIVQGYLQEMGTELSITEVRHFVYAGKFMIYMQAMRFLTDYLNDDSYYGASYKGHNYVRAQNQITLLERLFEKEAILDDIVSETARSLPAENKAAVSS